MALNRPFGALVQGLLSRINRTGAPAGGHHDDLARRALIDRLERHRSDLFTFNTATVQFTATASTANFNLDGTGPIATRIYRVLELWYLDSQGVLQPKDGVPHVHYRELNRELSVDTNDSDSVDMWAIHDEQLWIAPTTTGITLELEVVRLPVRLQWSYEGGDWSFYKNGSKTTTIDAETDPTGRFFDEGHDLLIAGGFLDLLEGELQGEEDDIRRASRRYQRVYDRLCRERERSEPEPTIEGYWAGD